jgi:ABC-2 type transport system ATP-binding protein
MKVLKLLTIKCQQGMSKFWNEKTTTLVVSRDLDFMKQSCRQTIWLEKGRIRFNGKADEAVDSYLQTWVNSLFILI